MRQISKKVDKDAISSDFIQNLIDCMIATMRSVNGAGIAAPQIGEPLQIFIAEVKNNPRYPYKPELPLTVLINPEIEFLTVERFINFEGCLSVPNLRGQVYRCPRILVRGFDRFGEKVESEYSGITAGTFQHENDHLNGKLFIDRIEDTTTICTWSEYEKNYSEEFRKLAMLTIEKYGS